LKKSVISSGGVFEHPARKRKILRNFDFILPKFHFILPKFYIPAPWRFFISSLEIYDFLGRGETRGGESLSATGDPLARNVGALGALRAI